MPGWRSLLTFAWPCPPHHQAEPCNGKGLPALLATGPVCRLLPGGRGHFCSGQLACQSVRRRKRFDVPFLTLSTDPRRLLEPHCSFVRRRVSELAQSQQTGCHMVNPLHGHHGTQRFSWCCSLRFPVCAVPAGGSEAISRQLSDSQQWRDAFKAWLGNLKLPESIWAHLLSCHPWWHDHAAQDADLDSVNVDAASEP